MDPLRGGEVSVTNIACQKWGLRFRGSSKEGGGHSYIEAKWEGNATFNNPSNNEDVPRQLGYRLKSATINLTYSGEKYVEQSNGQLVVCHFTGTKIMALKGAEKGLSAGQGIDTFAHGGDYLPFPDNVNRTMV